MGAKQGVITISTNLSLEVRITEYRLSTIIIRFVSKGITPC
jgi:hypothetical protein